MIKAHQLSSLTVRLRPGKMKGQEGSTIPKAMMPCTNLALTAADGAALFNGIYGFLGSYERR